MALPPGSKPDNAAAGLDFRVRTVEPPADHGAGEIRTLLARLLVRRYLEKHTTDASKRVAA